MTEIDIAPGFGYASNNSYPETVQFAVEFTKELGFGMIGDQVHKLWGNPGKLDKAAESWSYVSGRILATTKAELGNTLQIFDSGGWDGPAKTAYDKWINKLGLDVGVPLAGRAADLNSVMTELARLLRSIQRQLIMVCGEFVAALAAATGSAYVNKKGGGVHAKAPNAPYEGKHGAGRATRKVGAGLGILVIVSIIWDLKSRIDSLFEKCIDDMATLKAKIEKLKEKIVTYPPSPVLGMADPQKWGK